MIPGRRNNGGAPAWIITFADMMALLLCFFILLQMFSELKRDREYQRVANAVKTAFGSPARSVSCPRTMSPCRA